MVKSGTATEAGTATSGRPRDDRATAAILRAALELADEVGFDKLSIEGIAARAGVAKTTIYRRWASVSAIVMDAFLADVNRIAPLQERPTARESFLASMRLLARAYRSPQARVLRSLIGRAQLEPALLEAVRKRWVEPRRQIARAIVRRGMETGELRGGLDPDVVLDALYGPIYHRLLVPYDNGALSDAYIETLVETVFAGLERQPKRTRRSQVQATARSSSR
jgi:AcrR family transcriptional regulator